MMAVGLAFMIMPLKCGKALRAAALRLGGSTAGRRLH